MENKGDEIYVTIGSIQSNLEDAKATLESILSLMPPAMTAGCVGDAVKSAMCNIDDALENVESARSNIVKQTTEASWKTISRSK